MEPFLERIAPGCYVRVGIGDRDGKPIYRVAEVTAVKDGYESPITETPPYLHPTPNLPPPYPHHDPTMTQP